MHKAVCLAAAIAAGVVLSASTASAQLRIVTLNASNSGSTFAGPRAGMSTILGGIGTAVLNDPNNSGPTTGIAKRIDILCLQEVFTPQTTGAQYAALLNSMYGTTSFSYGTIAGGSSGSGTQGYVYNSAKVQLVGETAFGQVDTSNLARQVVRGQFSLVGYGSDADLYIYNSHYKSGDTARRLAEATAIRNDADALGPNKNIIYLGDYNVVSSTEPAMLKLASAGNGKGFDPINQAGTWNNNSTYKNIHTQSPYNVANGTSGFDGGGMTSRFDIQYITANLNDRNGLAYIPNSYQCYGNNGSHIYGQPIDSGTGAPGPILTQLAKILDHLPVGADYQLPARMGVTVGSVPPKVITGANVGVDVTVANTAPVQFSNGADGLTYTVSGAGSLTGSGGATDKLALTAGNLHTLSLSTATPGLTTGTVNVSSSSEAVANGTFSAPVSTIVLGHSTPSFAPDQQLESITFDFGIHGRGLGGASDDFLITNLNQFGALTAKLDLDSINGVGNTTALSTNVATFSNMAGGSFNSYTASLSDVNNGSFSATYTLNFSDENLPGAIARGPLTVSLTGIVATPGDADLNNVINFDDYAHIDNGFNNGLTGWVNGDFDGNGVINFDDYSLIDFNFNLQFNTGPNLNSVPEPALAGVQALACTLLSLRRRRRSHI